VAEVTKQLYVTSRDDWRAWLKENHDVEQEVWLVYYKKHTGKPRIHYDDAVEEALCFGWIDSIVKKIDAEKYIQKYTPRKQKSIWSEANKKRAERMIKQGRMTEAGLAKIKEAKQNGEWEKGTSREDPKGIPADLRRALAANKKARQNFEDLAPSCKKQFIWWISTAKMDRTRQRRIKETVRLAQEKKKLGMK
jgi:uncharacterized protein YdeI (YjbR/CyaY-like superfamily)